MVFHGNMHMGAAGSVTLQLISTRQHYFLAHEAICTALSDMASNCTLFLDRGPHNKS